MQTISRFKSRSAAAAVALAAVSVAGYVGLGASAANAASAKTKTLTTLLVGSPGAAPDTKPALSGAAGWAIHLGKGQAILAKYGYHFGGDIGFESGVPAESALIAGSVQLVAIGGPPALEGAGQGHPTRAIFASGGATDFSIAAPTGGITNVSQLAGKKVGVGVGTIMQQYLNFILARKGLTGKVTVVNLPNVADAYPALLNHSIDAYVDSGTQVAEWVAKGGVASVENSFTDYPGYGSSEVVAATKTFLKAHANIQQAWWALYSEGQKLIKKNPTAYLKWTAKESDVPLTIERQTARITYQSTPISKSGLEAAQQAQEFLLSAKLIPKLVNLKTWFVNYPRGTT